MKISLKERNIPRNGEGDPNFHSLEQLLTVFGSLEVVELINRSLYQLEYQASSHSKYRSERLALERPVKEMFKQLFPRESFAKATNAQLSRCLEELKTRR